jgi:hypothetical protein
VALPRAAYVGIAGITLVVTGFDAEHVEHIEKLKEEIREGARSGAPRRRVVIHTAGVESDAG